MTTTTKPSVADRLHAARPHPMTHAILSAMIGRDPVTTARYVGRATTTSDGFVMCNFVGANGDCHMGAFVSSYDEIERNVLSVADTLGFDDDERDEVQGLLDRWVGKC